MALEAAIGNLTRTMEQTAQREAAKAQFAMASDDAAVRAGERAQKPHQPVIDTVQAKVTKQEAKPAALQRLATLVNAAQVQSNAVSKATLAPKVTTSGSLEGLTITPSSVAALGTHQFEILGLFNPQKYIISRLDPNTGEDVGFDNATSVVTALEHANHKNLFTVAVGGGGNSTIEIGVGGANTSIVINEGYTLTDIRDAINTANIALDISGTVVARIEPIKDGSNNCVLIIEGTDSGRGNYFSVNPAAASVDALEFLKVSTPPEQTHEVIIVGEDGNGFLVGDDLDFDFNEGNRFAINGRDIQLAAIAGGVTTLEQLVIDINNKISWDHTLYARAYLIGHGIIASRHQIVIRATPNPLGDMSIKVECYLNSPAVKIPSIQINHVSASDLRAIVDGSEVYSADGNFTSIIPGVEIAVDSTLAKVGAKGTFTIGLDPADVAAHLKSVIDTVNKILYFVEVQRLTDAGYNKINPLGDETNLLKSCSESMITLISSCSGIRDGYMSSLSRVGVVRSQEAVVDDSIGSEASVRYYSLNNAVLTDVLANRPDEVRRLVYGGLDVDHGMPDHFTITGTGPNIKSSATLALMTLTSDSATGAKGGMFNFRITKAGGVYSAEAFGGNLPMPVGLDYAQATGIISFPVGSYFAGLTMKYAPFTGFANGYIDTFNNVYVTKGAVFGFAKNLARLTTPQTGAITLGTTRVGKALERGKRDLERKLDEQSRAGQAAAAKAAMLQQQREARKLGSQNRMAQLSGKN